MVDTGKLASSTTLTHLHSVLASRTIDDLRKTATAFCEDNGFTYWTYGLVGPDSALTNYPAEAVRHYLVKRLHRGGDPVMKKAVYHHRAVSWDTSDFLRGTDLTAAERHALALRNDVGARAGVSALTYERVSRAFEFAITSCSCDRRLGSAERRHCEVQLQLFAAYFHSVATDIVVRTDASPSSVELTDQQRDCLTWAAAGKTSWEIGRIMGITEATVKDHIRKIGAKLETSNRRVMISRGIRLGLIQPPR